MNMNEAMKAEQDEAVATLEKANDLLLKMFGLTGDEEDE